MRFIVNNLLYDTDKAELLAEGNRTYEVYNILFKITIYPVRKVSLYKTEKGNYFFTYKADYGVMHCEPVDEGTAKDFLAHNNYDKYAELYGELEEA